MPIVCSLLPALLFTLDLWSTSKLVLTRHVQQYPVQANWKSFDEFQSYFHKKLLWAESKGFFLGPINIIKLFCTVHLILSSAAVD